MTDFRDLAIIRPVTDGFPMKVDIFAFLKRYRARPVAAGVEGDPRAALDQLDRDRQAVRDAIAAAHRQRRELLLQPDTDAAITKTDREIDRLNLLAERFDAAETTLIEACREQDRAARRARLFALIDQYAATLDLFRDGMHVAADARASLIDLRATAVDEGFGREVDLFMDLPAPMLASRENADRFVDAAQSLLCEATSAEAAPVYNVQVVSRVAHFLPGDLIGLGEHDAREYLDAGAVIPVAGTRLPPAPAAPDAAEMPMPHARVDVGRHAGRLYTVRMKATAGIYHAGELASFEAAEASRYVEAGLAVWAGTDVAPRPAADAAPQPKAEAAP